MKNYPCESICQNCVNMAQVELPEKDYSYSTIMCMKFKYVIDRYISNCNSFEKNEA